MLEDIVLKLSRIVSTPAMADSLGGRLSSGLTEATSYTCTPSGAGGGLECLAGYVGVILDFSIPLAVLVVIGIMVYSAYIMITSQGNPEKLSEAREAVTNAVVGFALIALSIAILLLIQNTLKIPIPVN